MDDVEALGFGQVGRTGLKDAPLLLHPTMTTLGRKVELDGIPLTGARLRRYCCGVTLWAFQLEGLCRSTGCRIQPTKVSDVIAGVWRCSVSQLRGFGSQQCSISDITHCRKSLNTTTRSSL